jgi:uncharacterized protein YjbI with pentapeptide repeats
MIKLTQSELNDLLAKHAIWVKDNSQGEWLNLCGKDISGLDMRRANMSEANMRNTTGSDFVAFYGFGSSRRQTLYSPSLDIIFCGCFKGNLATFKKQVAKEYPDAKSLYSLQYEMIISNMELMATFPKTNE